jgi:hypothetical protein
MRSDGAFGAVAGIERVRNPVRVARAVMDSPHLLLQGDGATRFARTLGMPDYDPTTPDALRRSRDRQAVLLGADVPPEWQSFDWRAHWNFEAPLPDALRADGGAHDTVGVAVRSADGRFAAALSTGGLSLAMHGRVGNASSRPGSPARSTASSHPARARGKRPITASPSCAAAATLASSSFPWGRSLLPPIARWRGPAARAARMRGTGRELDRGPRSHGRLRSHEVRDRRIADDMRRVHCPGRQPLAIRGRY